MGGRARVEFVCVRAAALRDAPRPGEDESEQRRVGFSAAAAWQLAVEHERGWGTGAQGDSLQS